MREISAGAVIFKKRKGRTKFLLLYHGGDYWNFPKGKINRGENEQEAALREIEEETGTSRANIRLFPRFRQIQRYVYRLHGRTIFKIVVLFLAETRGEDIRISREHEGFGWFLYKDARRMVKHKNSRTILDEAMAYLRKKRGMH